MIKNVLINFSEQNHGIIIQTEITCKKSLVIRATQLAGGLLLNIKYVKQFWILAGVRKCRILIGLCKEAFFNCPIIFLEWHNKMKLVPASFSGFSDFQWRKQSFL